ncbi:MAG: hypothetical protein K9J16_06940 [Melioribacteraceae bacterium]|nr:hypothetical protein [Melioribacteraceae bacterium]MCF8354529.1 hypothetical protein [Melioribacteraceae bacterium]MCF8394298.1 hypothetical protein [Melioribacteraceae bacterium]MCF8418198.1 hypothetical protein [Melioribacteraceae bacterium]
MIKKYFYLIVFLFGFSSISIAQNEVGWISKFGTAVGFTPYYLMPDYSELNKQLPAFGVDDFSGGLFSYGGGGYIYILVVENLRIGGTGFNGTASETKFFNGFDREVIYSVGGGALTIEYTIPSIRNVAVSFGAMIGAGSQEIEIFRNNQNFSWNGVWSEFSASPDADSYSRKLTRDYYILSPTINVDIPLNRFIAFRIGGGYLFTLGNDWTTENEIELTNVSSGLKSDSFFIQTGIFLGFFAF